MLVNRLKQMWNKWVVLASTIILIMLCLITILIFLITKPAETPSADPTSVILVIPAPTLTLTMEKLIELSPTPMAASRGGIAVGSFVQIAGTEGSGLRLRAGPGINYSADFVGMDAEVFEVKDGPVDADGYIWWYLVAPYDTSRSGWAASQYLTIIALNPKRHLVLESPNGWFKRFLPGT
jgi:hypothetical protein